MHKYAQIWCAKETYKKCRPSRNSEFPDGISEILDGVSFTSIHKFFETVL
jgi:hypothetical protein